MAKDINLIWVCDEAEYFYVKGWTGISDLPAGQPQGWVERSETHHATMFETAMTAELSRTALDTRSKASSPHERGDMRGTKRTIIPGYRYAHPGYACYF